MGNRTNTTNRTNMLASRFSHAVEPFSETSVFKKIIVQFFQLSVQQIVCLVKKTDETVGSRFRGLEVGQIRRIRLIGHIRNPADFESFRVIFIPDGQSSLPQEIFIIAKEFFETRSSNSYQL